MAQSMAENMHLQEHKCARRTALQAGMLRASQECGSSLFRPGRGSGARGQGTLGKSVVEEKQLNKDSKERLCDVGVGQAVQHGVTVRRGATRYGGQWQAKARISVFRGGAIDK